MTTWILAELVIGYLSGLTAVVLGHLVAEAVKQHRNRRRNERQLGLDTSWTFRSNPDYSSVEGLAVEKALLAQRILRRPFRDADRGGRSSK
jgi:hypothetical protein